jgi:hypothetical protein
MFSDNVRSLTNPQAVKTKNAVEEVVQRNLRLVLGAQFTEKEGERLIARAYNDRLDTQENAKRVNRLITQIKNAAETKADAIRYFEQNGTLTGWNGKLPSMSDFTFDDRATDRAKQPTGGAPTPGAAPSASPQDAEALAWANANPNDPRSAAIKQRLGAR